MTPRAMNLRLDPWDDVEVTPPRKRAAKESPEDLFASHCRQFQLPQVERQAYFAKAEMQRQWRFDFAWHAYQVAVEIEGVSVRRQHGQLIVSGRHATIEGIRGDMEKYNTAALLGWTVLRFLQTDVKPKLAIETTIRMLTAKGWRP